MSGIGKKVYIEELNQVGTVRSMAAGKIENVEVETPDGPKLINILEKGYKVISLILAFLKLLLNFFGK